MRFLRFCAGLLLAIALIGGALWMYAVNWTPSRTDYAVQGIDVTEASGAINWSVVRAMDVDFAYARATAGVGFRDGRFPDYWAGMIEAGVRRGAIHVFSLCGLASEQAGNFVATVPRDPDALPVAIDLAFQADCPARPVRDVVLGEIRELASVIETHSGKPAMLRVSPDFEAAYRVSEAIPRPLWNTRLFVAPTYSTRPWRMWQSSTIRRVEGVERPVNWNVVAP